MAGIISLCRERARKRHRVPTERYGSSEDAAREAGRLLAIIVYSAVVTVIVLAVMWVRG